MPRAPSSQRKFALVGQHAFQDGLIGLIGHHALMQLFLALMRLGSQDVAAERVVANDFARPGLLKPFGRTGMCL